MREDNKETVERGTRERLFTNGAFWVGKTNATPQKWKLIHHGDTYNKEENRMCSLELPAMAVRKTPQMQDKT